ncbi:aminotransferase class IV [Streptomyces rubiginosohelvolus]|uniref:aminotransferase class IV n=1 Tax=Streptomyces rubiginosohelvolus TaxID=67362 RepID=UPI0036759449
MKSQRVLEVDGAPATVDSLRWLALLNYGHSTAMQVRGGAVRGLDLHLQRLDSATRELFDVPLSSAMVRARIGSVLRDCGGNATVRVYAYAAEASPGVSMLVMAEPPREPDVQPRALRSVAYQRPAAHLKHIGTFGKLYHERRAASLGYDSILLTSPEGLVSECATTNIGFFDGKCVVWPEGPALRGITMSLLERHFEAHGFASRLAPVHLKDVAGFQGAFTANSRGVTPVGRVDDVKVPIDSSLMSRLYEVYDALPWDRI